MQIHILQPLPPSHLFLGAMLNKHYTDTSPALDRNVIVLSARKLPLSPQSAVTALLPAVCFTNQQQNNWKLFILLGLQPLCLTQTGKSLFLRSVFTILKTGRKLTFFKLTLLIQAVKMKHLKTFIKCSIFLISFTLIILQAKPGVECKYIDFNINLKYCNLPLLLQCIILASTANLL